MDAKEAVARGFTTYCLECFKVYRTVPDRQYEDGHGGRRLEMCRRCGCDLFGSLVDYAAKAREVSR